MVLPDTWRAAVDGRDDVDGSSEPTVGEYHGPTMVRWLGLWIRTRRQKSIRRLRGNVAWDGDIHASRADRVTSGKATARCQRCCAVGPVRFALGVRTEVVQPLTPVVGG
jgi:hypothetical protein